MGNNPSATSRSPANSSTPAQTSHEPAKAVPSRKDPRNLIQAQRASAEPSLAQARGTTTTTHRTRTLQTHTAPHLSNTAASPASSIDPGVDSQVRTQQSESEPTKPVDVPIPAPNPEAGPARSYAQSFEPSGPPVIPDMSYHITRPPRLPLPIEEEVHTPGSPIIAPADVDSPVVGLEALDKDSLPRGASALSNTTIDEEDAEELEVDKTKATVPTTFEWRQGGDKVYVTGTIFHWNKKHRLHPVDGQPDLLKAVIPVRPGTHHIRFIVDTVMQCSNDLPTTVDFGNNLVNYIEVSADDLPEGNPSPTEVTNVSEAGSQSRPHSPPKHDELQPIESENINNEKPTPRMRIILPPERYSSNIPQYLLDLDKSEDSNEYQYAAAAIEKLPTPPSLPGFLGKPILNAATPMKDDNSVLTMPNHTVLNHLATSSIKNNVLAVSATTRYKRKYVTTIMYKPTGDD